MRSRATHFSGIIKFVVFICVILLLIYVVVYWSRQNKHQPVATGPAEVSQQTNEDDSKNKSTDKKGAKSDSGGDKENTPKSQKKSSDTKDTKKAAPTASTSTGSTKPDKIPGDNTKKPVGQKPGSAPVASSKVPDTGLGLEQALVAATGISLTVYLAGNYWQTRSWHQLER